VSPETPAAFVVDGLKAHGKTGSSRLREQIQRIRENAPDAPVVVLLDEADAGAVQAAREAGATDFFGKATAKNPAALEWRISALLERSAARRRSPRKRPAPPLGLSAGPLATPEPAEVQRALARVEAGSKRAAAPTRPRARDAAVVNVGTPELRDAHTGRLDARLIAERLGVSVNRLAPAAGVSQQALSKRPDSPRAQKPLAGVARVLGALDELGVGDRAKMWLNTPHPRLGGEPPLELILGGRAGEVARMLERALEGIAD
jgi:CheY-like chemotaxis protein